MLSIGMHEIIGQLCKQAIDLIDESGTAPEEFWSKPVVVVITGDTEEVNEMTYHGPYDPKLLLAALKLDDHLPADDITIPRWDGTEGELWMEFCAGGFIVFADVPVGPGELFTLRG